MSHFYIKNTIRPISDKDQKLKSSHLEHDTKGPTDKKSDTSESVLVSNKDSLFLPPDINV